MGAAAVSFALHRARELASDHIGVQAVSVSDGSALWAVMLEFSASALVFMAAPFVVYALVSRRPPILDGDRERH